MDDDTLITTIEDNFEDTPEEVKDFIASDEFEAVIQEINRYLQDELEKITLTNTITLFLYDVKSLDELSDYIDKLSITEDKKVLIKRIIQDKIINELLVTIEVHEEMDKNVEEDPTTTATKIVSPLTTLSDRLKQASIASPSKRDYGLNKSSTSNVSSPTSVETPTDQVRSIDPYHEPVDNT